VYTVAIDKIHLATPQNATPQNKVIVLTQQDYQTDNVDTFRVCPSSYSNNNLSVGFSLSAIPLINSLQDSFLTAWEEGVSIQEDEGVIFAEYVAAGEKNSANQFEGAIIGKRLSKNGLTLYNNGIRSMYVSKEGIVEIGESQDKIIIDGTSGQLKLGVQNSGIKIDLKHQRIDMLKNAASEENDDSTKYFQRVRLGNKNYFVIEENGTLNFHFMKSINDTIMKYPWYEWNGSEIVSIKDQDNKKLQDKFFINGDIGRVGANEILIQTGKDNPQGGGFWPGIQINGKAIHFGVNDLWSKGDTPQRYKKDRGAFALSSKGIVACMNEEYAALSSVGWLASSKGLVVGEAPYPSEQHVRCLALTKDGLYGKEKMKITDDDFQLLGNGVQINGTSTENNENCIKFASLKGLKQDLTSEKTPESSYHGIVHIDTNDVNKVALSTKGKINIKGNICTTGTIYCQQNIIGSSDVECKNIDTEGNISAGGVFRCNNYRGLTSEIDITDPSYDDKKIATLFIEGGIIVGITVYKKNGIPDDQWGGNQGWT
jgi:hypothetical protein